MSTNPYQATRAIPAERTDWAAVAIAFSVYAGVISIALLGVVVWGALIFAVVQLITEHRSIIEYFGKFHIAALPLIFAPFPLAFGIHKKSRLCAAVPALAYPALTMWIFRYGDGNIEWEWTLSIPAFFILASFLGLVGTIVYHRRRKASQ